jgi:hypothetical protein
MRTSGKLSAVSRDMDGGLVLSFRCFEEKKVMRRMAEIKDKPLWIEVTENEKKRSLSANALYWSLVGKLAAYLHISNSRMHNILLRRYGTAEEIDGEELVCFIPDTDEAEERALEADSYHVRPTSATKTFKDGSTRRMYKILKGSHEYTTKEMSTLINGLIDECNHAGIPTATPDEVAEIMKRYEKHHAERG